MGRPAKNPQCPRNVRLQVVVTREDAEAIERMRDGRSVSDVLLEALRHWLRASGRRNS